MLTDIELKTITDEELISELKQGRQEALTYIFDRYYRLVFSVALKILRDRGEAEDLMQDVFIEIYRSAKTWILQYAYHRSLNRKKYLALRHFYDNPGDSALNQHEYSNSLRDWNKISYEDWTQTIKKGVQTLSEMEQKVLELAFFQGFLLKEISVQLDEPLSNVKNHYYRGLKKLRGFLQENTSLREKMA